MVILTTHTTSSTIFVPERDTHMFNVMSGGVEPQRELLSMSISSSSSSTSSTAAATATPPPPSHPTSSSYACAIARQKQQQPSGASHLPANIIHPAEMTNTNYKNNIGVSSDSIADINMSIFGGMFRFSALMPFLQTIKRFLVSLVYAPPSPFALANHQHVSADSDDDDDDDNNTDYIDDDYTGALDSNKCSLIDSLIDASLLFPTSSLSTRRSATNDSYATFEQPESFLHTSLLELIAMEAPQCLAAPAQLAHGLGAAVDLYLNGRSDKPEPTASAMQAAPQHSPRRGKSCRMVPNKQHKRMKQNGNGGGHILWPKCNGSESSTTTTTAADERLHSSPTASPPATTMHSLARTLNVKPVHKHANKNRREKERHELTRHIHDDLYDANNAATCEDDTDIGKDTVDFCIVRASASVSALTCATSMFSISVPVPDSKLQQQKQQQSASSTTSFMCFTHEDFPEMRPKGANSATANTATNTAVVAVSVAPIATVVSITVTASTPASFKPSLSWEISVDELRTPSKRPSSKRNGRSNNGTAAPAAVSSVDTYASTSAITTQYQQLLLAGLRPHRERQISECSDDFICFERDDDAVSEGSICYDIADDSSDSDETDDDDDDSDDDDSEDDTDDSSDDDEVTTRPSKPAPVAIVADSASVSDSESETNSATHQLDSGIEEKKLNKVRFAVAPKVHYIYVWQYACRQARKAYWEQVGRDRMRFADRVERMQEILDPVLIAEHREHVLRRRAERPGCNVEQLM